MKRTLVLSLLLLAACSPKKEKAPVKPESTPPSVEAPVAEPESQKVFDTAAMDALLSEAVNSGTHIGVSALVFDEGEVVYSGAFGLRDRERNLPVEMDTVFRIYSMTKPITSAVIMDLREDGLLSLEDPVSKYIPELANMKVAELDAEGNPVMLDQDPAMTIKDLLLHRAGIAYGIFGDINPVEKAYMKADLFNPDEDLSVKMTKLSQLPLAMQPGEGWYYSYSIDVLGRVAEIVTGQSFAEVLDERIFDPLGMTETGFYVRPDQAIRFASNYALTKDGDFILQDDAQTSSYLKKPAYESGGGGLVSTLGDYAKFARMLLQGGELDGTRILEEDTVKMMMSNQMDADDKFLMPWFGEPGEAGFGYGGRVITGGTPEGITESGEGVGQFGWGGMAKTVFWVDEPNNAFAILMLQMFSEHNPQLHTDFQRLVHQETKNAE